MPHLHRNHPRGALAILTLLGVTVFALAVVSTLATLAASESQMAGAEQASAQTFYAAESGLNQVLYSLAQNPVVTPPTPTIPGFTITLNITPDPGFPIVSPPAFQGNVSVTTTDSTGKSRIIKVKATNSSFGGTIIYGAQTDKGGIRTAASGSTIKGDVFSNGPVSVGGSINVEGDVTVADDATIDQQDIQQDNEFPFGVHVGSIYYTDAAQGFLSSASGILNRFSLLLRKVCVLPACGTLKELKWQIVADNGGKPANTYLIIGGSEIRGFVDAADVGTSLGWVNVNLSTLVPTSLCGARCWLVLDTADSAGDYWVWGKDSADTYAGGSAYYNASWTSSAGWVPVEADSADLSFKTWLGSKYQSLTNVTTTGNAWASNISTNSKVCGDAYYQTISPGALNFLNDPSTCASPTPGTGTPTDNLPQQKPLPITINDIRNPSHTGWEDQITNIGNPVLPSQDINNSTTKFGWQEISGSLSIHNNETLYLTGNPRVTGNVTFGQGSTIMIDPSVPSTQSLLLLVDGIVDQKQGASVCGSDCSAATNFLLVISANEDKTATCTASSSASIVASNNSSSGIFAAPLGSLKVEQGTINAGASYSLCLKTSVVVNFTSVKDAINKIFVPSPTQQPLSAVANSWSEQ